MCTAALIGNVYDDCVLPVLVTVKRCEDHFVFDLNPPKPTTPATVCAQSKIKLNIFGKFTKLILKNTLVEDTELPKEAVVGYEPPEEEDVAEEEVWMKTLCSLPCQT